MSKPLIDRIPFAKIVTIFAVSFGVGLGLCGLGFFLNTHGPGRNGEFGGVLPLSVLSVLILLVSLFGLVISLLAWAVVGIARRFGWLGGKESRRLFDEPEEIERDGRHDT